MKITILGGGISAISLALFIKNKDNYFQILGDGYQKKPYVHVDELIRIIEKIIKQKKFKNQFFNLTPNDSGVSVRYIAERIKKIFESNKKILYQKNKFGWKGDVPVYSYKNNFKKQPDLQFKLSSKETINVVLNNIKNDK
jgi:nucleoside-diphosphate-sugar epimerase